MPTYRDDHGEIPVYRPGKPIAELAAELGIEDIVKVASNECPEPPFPEVVEAIATATTEVNRYPETTSPRLSAAVAGWHGVDDDQVWVGAGSTQLLGCMALSVGGPGTSAVFATPSFVMYDIATRVAMATPRAVPLATGHLHDLDAMADAIRDDTTVLYVCNPNNPTGTHVPAAAVTRLIELVPDDVLVVVDEAYAEYVTAPDWETAIPHALTRDNVVVTRTFSKIFGLAGLRTGYAIGVPETLNTLRAVQAPFSVTVVAQRAAEEALRHPDRLEERAKANAAGREWLAAELAARGLEVPPSQANFVYAVPDSDPGAISDALLAGGVIVRRLGPGLRITIGTPEENERLIATWDEVVA